MGFGYFLAIASNMPPLEGDAIDIRQGREFRMRSSA